MFIKCIIKIITIFIDVVINNANTDNDKRGPSCGVPYEIHQYMLYESYDIALLCEIVNIADNLIIDKQI